MTEPDREQWQHAGYACLAVRHQSHGHWCSYVGVDRSHPAFGIDPLMDQYDVLAGVETMHELNYGAPCLGVICHVPEPGMPDDVWWLGMDFGHSFDFAPGRAARQAEAEARSPTLRAMAEQLRSAEAKFPNLRERYRTLPYVKAAAESLARQLRELTRPLSAAAATRQT